MRDVAPASSTQSPVTQSRYDPLFLLAAFLLATSKWGSYLPIGAPPFISDLVLVGVLVARLLASSRGAQRRPGTETWVAVFAFPLLAWVLLSLALSQVSLDELRDAAPYCYLVVVFLVRPRSWERRDVGRVVMGALVFHAAWVTVAEFLPGVVASIPPTHGIYWFLLRNDFDGQVCGLLGAMALHRALSHRRPVLHGALAVWGLALTLHLGSRAGLLSTTAAVALVLLLGRSRPALPRLAARLSVIIALLCIPVVLVGLLYSLAGQRLLVTIGLKAFVQTSEATAGAEGTRNARRDSWRVLIAWNQDDPARMAKGVGFGPDFMHASGADLPLIGGYDPDIRSPHNYFLGTWSRLGIVGLLLTIGLLFAGLRLVLLLRRHPRLDDADVLAMLLIVSIPISSALGVVLESPFGAVPFFWAIGRLSSAAVESGRSTPFQVYPQQLPGQPTPAHEESPAA